METPHDSADKSIINVPPPPPAVPQRSSSSSSNLTSISVTALDAIVNVNSLFTVATFIGLSFTPSADSTVAATSPCNATVEKARHLILYEVVSFAFFLFSSVIAQGLKLSINIANSIDKAQATSADIHMGSLLTGLVGSGLGSVLGCVFLALSMVEVIEVKLGLLRCGGKSVYAAATVGALVGSSLLAYLWLPLHVYLRRN